MIYPKKINAKKSEVIIRNCAIVSIVTAIVLVIINKILTPQMHWAALCNAKNINIAAHVLIQTVAISVLAWYIDHLLGAKGWSLNVAIPILIIIANTTMLVLTIVSSRRYVRYAIYQLIILMFSVLPIIFIYEHMIQDRMLSYVAIGISMLNFILTLVLSASDVKDEIIRKFHT